jgi:hypothetical protein
MPSSELPVSKPIGKRLSATLNSELEQRLCAYVAADGGSTSLASRAATAAALGTVGLGCLLTPESAHARIVYTPLVERIEPLHCTRHFFQCRGSVQIDFNNDGVADAVLSNTGNGISSVWYANLSAKGLGSNQVLQASNVGCGFRDDYAAVLRLGSEVGPNGKFAANEVMSHISYRSLSTNLCGPWRNATGKFLGFKLTIDGETHYGWIRVTVRAGAFDQFIGATVTGYAYETVPDVPIAAGAEGDDSSLDVMPNDPPTVHAALSHARLVPATLGVLATGAPGLEFWRTPR